MRDKGEAVAGSVRYVRKRKGIFYYERRWPTEMLDELGRRGERPRSPLFRKSLRTAQQSIALLKACEAESQYDARVAAVLNRAGAPTLDGVDSRPALTDLDLASIRAKYRDLERGSWPTAYLLAEVSPEWRDHLERMITVRGEDAIDIKNRLLGHAPVPFDPAVFSPAEALESEVRRFAIERGSAHEAALSRAIKAGMLDGQRDIDRCSRARCNH